MSNEISIKNIPIVVINQKILITLSAKDIFNFARTCKYFYPCFSKNIVILDIVAKKNEISYNRFLKDISYALEVSGEDALKTIIKNKHMTAALQPKVSESRYFRKRCGSDGYTVEERKCKFLKYTLDRKHLDLLEAVAFDYYDETGLCSDNTTVQYIDNLFPTICSEYGVVPTYFSSYGDFVDSVTNELIVADIYLEPGEIISSHYPEGYYIEEPDDEKEL